MGRNLLPIADAGAARLIRWFVIMAEIALGISMLLSVVDVVSAKLFKAGIPSVVEFVTELNVPMLFGALAFIELERGHIRTDEMFHWPRKVSYVLKLISYLIEILVCAFLTWRSLFLVQEMFTGIHRSGGAIRFPYWPSAVIVFLGFALLTIASILALTRAVAVYPKTKLDSSPLKVT
jgi:TRAP-type mannitol/chloroaromatic compound transport system permease small subunit